MKDEGSESPAMEVRVDQGSEMEQSEASTSGRLADEPSWTRLKDFLVKQGEDGGAPDYHRALQRLKTAAIRGAAVGVVLKGGLHTLSALLHLLKESPRGRKNRKARPVTLNEALQDTVRYVLFLASLGGSYGKLCQAGAAHAMQPAGTAGPLSWEALTSHSRSNLCLTLCVIVSLTCAVAVDEGLAMLLGRNRWVGQDRMHATSVQQTAMVHLSHGC